MIGSCGRAPKLLIPLVILLLVTVSGYIALQIADKTLNEAYAYRSSTGTVIKKELVLFDDTNRSYINDLGDRIEKRPGEKEYRIYFYFDEFTGYGETSQSRLIKAERKRVSENRPHFKTFDHQHRYDEVKVGDKLIISYKAYSGGAFDIVYIDKVRP